MRICFELDFDGICIGGGESTFVITGRRRICCRDVQVRHHDIAIVAILIGGRRHRRHFRSEMRWRYVDSYVELVPWYKAREPVIDYRAELPDFVILTTYPIASIVFSHLSRTHLLFHNLSPPQQPC